MKLRSQELIAHNNEIVNDTTNTDTSNENVDFSLSQDSSGIIMDTLTKIYSNPAIAVIREYLSNAVDAERRIGKLGVGEPINLSIIINDADVKIDLRIQDHGIGMSKEQILKIFTNYGKSDKRDSNKEIGGFGIGSKSALAITDTFTIKSIKDGFSTTALITRKPGCPANLEITEHSKTTDPSGTLVSIKLDYSYIYSIMKISPTFWAGLSDKEYNLDTNDHTLEEGFNRMNLSDKNWEAIISPVSQKVLGYRYINAESDHKYRKINPFMNIGGVTYQFDNSNKIDKEYKHLNFVINNLYGFIMTVPVGTLHITPSRENIIYDSHTLQNLEKCAKNFLQTLSLNETMKLSSIKNYKKVLETISTDLPFYKRIEWADTDIKKVTYKDAPIYFSVKVEEGDSCLFYHSKTGNKIYKSIDKISYNEVTNGLDASFFSKYKRWSSTDDKKVSLLVTTDDVQTAISRLRYNIKHIIKMLNVQSHDFTILLDTPDSPEVHEKLVYDSISIIGFDELMKKVKKWKAGNSTKNKNEENEKTGKLTSYALREFFYKTESPYNISGLKYIDRLNESELKSLKNVYYIPKYSLWKFNNFLEIISPEFVESHKNIIVLSAQHKEEKLVNEYPNVKSIIPELEKYEKEYFKDNERDILNYVDVIEAKRIFNSIDSKFRKGTLEGSLDRFKESNYDKIVDLPKEMKDFDLDRTLCKQTLSTNTNNVDDKKQPVKNYFTYVISKEKNNELVEKLKNDSNSKVSYVYRIIKESKRLNKKYGLFTPIMYSIRTSAYDEEEKKNILEQLNSYLRNIESGS